MSFTNQFYIELKFQSYFLRRRLKIKRRFFWHKVWFKSIEFKSKRHGNKKNGESQH